MNFAACIVALMNIKNISAKGHKHTRRIQKQQPSAYIIFKEKVTAHEARK